MHHKRIFDSVLAYWRRTKSEIINHRSLADERPNLVDRIDERIRFVEAMNASGE